MSTHKQAFTAEEDQHSPDCAGVARGEWEADLSPEHPDTEWICRDCGAVIKALQH